MKSVVTVFLLFIAFVCPATAQQLLIKATRGGKVVYLVPETHLGTPVERTRFFYDKVLPLARSSEKLLLEAVKQDITRRIYPGKPECKSSTPNSNSDHVINALNLGKKVGGPNFFFILEPSLFPYLSSFSKLDILFNYGFNDALGSPDATLNFLTTQKINYESIEEIDDFYSIFCDLPTQQRFEVLVKHATVANCKSNGTQKEVGSKVIEEYFLWTMKQISCRLEDKNCRPEHVNKIITLTEACQPPMHHMIADPDLRAYYLRDRNMRWIPTLERMLISHDSVMFIVGSFHMLDIDDTKGLITLLEESGFKLTIEAKSEQRPN